MAHERQRHCRRYAGGSGTAMSLLAEYYGILTGLDCRSQPGCRRQYAFSAAARNQLRRVVLMPTQLHIEV